MTLGTILVCLIGALIYRFLPAAWRGWALLIGSVIGVYALQPALPLPMVDFYLPTLILILALIGWWLTRPPDTEGISRDDLISLSVVAGLPLLIAFMGSIDFLPRLSASPPPPFFNVIWTIVGFAVVSTAISPLFQETRSLNRLIPLYILAILALFAVLKTEFLATALSAWLRAQADRPLTLAGAVDVGWLGFSYVAFRLIHTLRDRQTGKLPNLTLREYFTYLIFFPAYTAGPIDRAERFVKDYRTISNTPDAAATWIGLGRIAAGLLKKFVIADSLALWALSPLIAERATTFGGAWVVLYAYAFRLYFDFSGYSDIAIGIGRLFGIQLPENFNAPYLKSNITQFWQSWHMSLSTWARFYVFMPLSRMMIRFPRKSLVVLAAQVGTMLVIGLWHGVALNFVIWGVWHGLGLWVHKLYSDRTRDFYIALQEQPTKRRIVYLAGVFVTFHFVVLGWVWFTLPDVSEAARFFGKLIGIF